jgi:hypothetical protein
VGQEIFPDRHPGAAPGIGHNSWNGPCYLDTDLSVARVQSFNVLGHETSVRFQANFYNVFKTNLAPSSSAQITQPWRTLSSDSLLQPTPDA